MESDTSKQERYSCHGCGEEYAVGTPCDLCQPAKQENGEYSCYTCGMAMLEPCEHWQTMLALEGKQEKKDGPRVQAFLKNTRGRSGDMDSSECRDAVDDNPSVISGGVAGASQEIEEKKDGYMGKSRPSALQPDSGDRGEDSGSVAGSSQESGRGVTVGQSQHTMCSADIGKNVWQKFEGCGEFAESEQNKAGMLAGGDVSNLIASYTQAPPLRNEQPSISSESGLGVTFVNPTLMSHGDACHFKGEPCSICDAVGRGVSMWISVKEKLPDEDELVLIAVVCGDEHHGDNAPWLEVHEGTLYTAGGCLVASLADNSEYMNEEVAGWMPLPDPPKVGAGE